MLEGQKTMDSVPPESGKARIILSEKIKASNMFRATDDHRRFLISSIFRQAGQGSIPADP
jgi:hypothetical protein